MATFTLITKVLKSQPSAAGDEVYQGGEVHDNQKMVATFGVVMNTINTVTNIQGLDTSLMTLQLFFTDARHGHGGQGQGGGGGGGGKQHGQAPETIVLQGANEFEGGQNQTQPRETVRAIGSVSAASPAFASLKDHQFTLERTGQVQGGFNVLKLTIAP